MSTMLMMSVTGGVMILVITLFRFLFQRFVHREVFVALWILAMLRLCIPVFVPARSSIYNLLQSENKTVTITVTDSYGQVVEHSKPMVPVQEATEVLTQEEGFRLRNAGSWLYATGGLCVLVYFTLTHWNSRRRFRFAIGQKEEALGKIRLARLEGLPAPLVYGLFRPKILLPEDFPEDGSEEYWHIIHHEMMHVRNGDLWIKAWALLTVAVHWCNPCVWLMLFLLSADLEMRCDQQVIEKYGQKKSYAMTLVRAEEQILSHLVHTCFAFSATQSRLKNIARAKLNSLRSFLTVCVLSAVLVLCFGTDAKAVTVDIEPMEQPVTTESVPMEEPTEPSFTEAPTETEGASEPTETLVTTVPTEVPTEEPAVEEPTETEPQETEVQQTPTKEQDSQTSDNPKYYTLDIGGMTVGDSLTLDVSQYEFGELSVSDPSAVRAWTTGITSSKGTTRTLHVVASKKGYVEIYANVWENGGYRTWCIASFYISPSEDTDSMSFAELDGNTPDIVIPEFDFQVPFN